MPPFKPVAIQPTGRGGIRKRPSPTVETAADAARAVPPASPHSSRQPVHLFRQGERLHMLGGGNIVTRQTAMCQVLALLPYEGYGELRYRVRSDSEHFERIVTEGDLSRD